MEAPGLSEITNMSADPERGTGTPAVVTDTSPIAKSVQSFGQQKLENDWRKYTFFQNNLKDLYKDAKDIQSMDLAPSDRKEMEKRVAGVFDKIGEDPQSFFGGGHKMQEIQKDLSNIFGDATQSKQDHMYDMAHREFLTRNPGFATPENMKKVDDYLNQPLGKRKAFLLQPAPVLDFDKMATALNTQVGKNFANTGFTGVDAQGNLAPGNNYIQKTKGKTYDTEKFMQLAEQSYDYKGDYGIKNRQAAESLFKELPEETQKAYGDARNWYLTNLAARHKEQEVTDSALTPNRFAEMSAKQKHDFAMEAYRQGDREKLAQFKHNLAMEGVPANTNFLLRQYASIVGNKTGQTLAVEVDPKKNIYETEEIINVPPDVLKKLSGSGKTTIKKGVGTTETTTLSSEPDAVTRTKDGDIRIIHYARETKGPRIGQVKMQGNKPAYESQEIIPKRELMGLLGKDFVEKKLIGTSVDAADALLKQKGEGVVDFLDQVNDPEDDGEGADQEESTVAAPASTSTTTSKGKSYKLGNKTFTESQVSKAAKQSGMTIEEYKKQVGLK